MRAARRPFFEWRNHAVPLLLWRYAAQSFLFRIFPSHAVPGPVMSHAYGLQTDRPARGRRLLWIALAAVPVFSMLGMGMATQKIAGDYAFQSGLGEPLATLGNMPVYAPWKVFTWQGVAPEIMDGAVTLGCAWFALPLLFLALCLHALRPRGNTSLHGTARWATKEEIKKMGYFSGSGVYVGGWREKGPLGGEHLHYLRHNGPEHVLCFAPTRSGKGIGLILPTLLSWPGSSVTLDIKGENWALTSGWRRGQGHKVLRFDPTDASGSGCAFNPLEELRLTRLEAIQDAQSITLMLVDPDGKGMGDHWTKAAFAFFAGVVLHCCIVTRANKGRSANLQDVALMMAGESGSTDDLFEAMTQPHGAFFNAFAPDTDPRVVEACHTFIMSSAREMQAKADRERSGVISSALVNLALYRDPIVAINTSRSDFHLHDLMNHDDPVDLYLVIPPNGIDRVRPLLRLMTDMIFRHVCARMEFADGTSKAGYRHRLLFMLDEFTSLGRLPIVEKAIAYVAGYGGKLYVIVQDIKQLNEVYGKDNALMSNCHVRIAYAPNDPETAELLSKMTGTTTVVEKKVSRSRGGASSSVSETARPLLTPDECSRLPGAEKDSQGRVTKPGHMLIFTAGQSPVYGMQILYFKDPEFLLRAKIPAPGICAQYPLGITDSLYFERSGEGIVQPPARTAADDLNIDWANLDSVEDSGDRGSGSSGD